MYKKILLSVLFFLTTINYAQIGLNLTIKLHDEKETKRQISQTIIVNENLPMVLEDDNFVAYVTAVMFDGKVQVETKFFEKTDNGELILVSSPVLLLELDKLGYVKLGKKIADKDVSSLVLEVKPFAISSEN